VTEKVKFVAVVPDPGDTEGPVMLPLSGHVAARTGLAKTARDATSQLLSAMALKKVARVRCREARNKMKDPLWMPRRWHLDPSTVSGR
jgi:hypothetical protein